jgi:hypothetical protein
MKLLAAEVIDLQRRMREWLMKRETERIWKETDF